MTNSLQTFTSKERRAHFMFTKSHIINILFRLLGISALSVLSIRTSLKQVSPYRPHISYLYSPLLKLFVFIIEKSNYVILNCITQILCVVKERKKPTCRVI